MKINIQNPGAGTLVAALGIPEERVKALHEAVKDSMELESHSESFGRFSEACETNEELVFAGYMYGVTTMVAQLKK